MQESCTSLWLSANAITTAIIIISGIIAISQSPFIVVADDKLKEFEWATTICRWMSVVTACGINCGKFMIWKITPSLENVPSCDAPPPPRPFSTKWKKRLYSFQKYIACWYQPKMPARLPASQLSFFGDNLDILYDDKTNLFALNKMRENFLFMINCQLEIFGISFSVAEQLNWWSTLLRFEAAVILAEICLTNDGCVWQCLGALDYQLRPHLLSLYRLLMSSCLMIKCSEWVKGFNALVVVVAAAGLFWDDDEEEE